MSNSSIWPIDRTLSSATTPNQSEPQSYGNEGELHIPPKLQGWDIAIRWFNLSCLQLVYSIASADWVAIKNEYTSPGYDFKRICKLAIDIF